MARMRGNPEALARNVADDLRKDLEKLLDDSLNTALQIIEDKRERVIKEMLESLREEYSRLEENYKSLKARLDLELKSKVSEKKSEFIDQVIEVALKRIKERKGEEWYRKFMEDIFEKLARESKEIGELIVEVSEGGKELAKELIDKMNESGAKLVLGESSGEIAGGARARDRNSTLVLDYSLDLFVKENSTLLRSIAAKALFGTSP